MEKKLMLAFLSAVLLGSFFVPYIVWDNFTMSGFDFVFSSHPPNYKYLLLALPLCAISMLLKLFFSDNVKLNNGFFLRTPLLALIILFLFFYINEDTKSSLGSMNPLNFYCFGSWIALATSILLAFRKKVITNYI